MTDIHNETSSSYQSGSGSSSLTAFFDNRAEAEAAVDRLTVAGISKTSIRVVAGNEADGRAAVNSDDKGFWAKLEDFFFGDDDNEVYSEGLRRGGYLVVVNGLRDAQYNTALNILDDEGSIDLNERAGQWRSEGWNSGTSNNGPASSSYDRNQASLASRDDTFDAGRDDTIEVVEENLRVGKRDVNNGSVRVRAYTVEQPVNEQVSLRDESVTIERHSVDRPLSDGDSAFQDRTISAEEHHEEAVVSKEARVVEEIGIRKTSTEHNETISDTVRKTEVEVEDGRTGRSQSQNGFTQRQN